MTPYNRKDLRRAGHELGYGIALLTASPQPDDDSPHYGPVNVELWDDLTRETSEEAQLRCLLHATKIAADPGLLDLLDEQPWSIPSIEEAGRAVRNLPTQASTEELLTGLRWLAPQLATHDGIATAEALADRLIAGE